VRAQGPLVVVKSKDPQRDKRVTLVGSLQVAGAVAFVGAEDVAGENLVYCGGADAELFASKKTEFVCQPLGVMVAEDPQAAKKAAGLVRVKYSHPKVNNSVDIGRSGLLFQVG